MSSEEQGPGEGHDSEDTSGPEYCLDALEGDGNKSWVVGPDDAIIVQVDEDDVRQYLNAIAEAKRHYPRLRPIPILVLPNDAKIGFVKNGASVS